VKSPPDTTARLVELGIRSVVFDSCADAPDTGDLASVGILNIAGLKAVY
jgi:hypothetical protein